MFNSYSYKKKFYALIVITVMLSYTAYKRSFSTLISVYNENSVLAQKGETLNEKSEKINALRTELSTINKTMGKENLEKEKIQHDIISFVTAKGDNILIHDMQSTHEFTDNNHIVYTNSLDIIGNLNQLLAMAYKFEKEFDSRLISMKFYKVVKNKTEVLHLKILFQNYENIN